MRQFDMLRTVSCIVALILTCAVPGTAVHAQTSKQVGLQIMYGKGLAEANCQRCHATGLSGKSTHAKAPPFWTMFDRRPVNTIADMLVMRASPAHSDMPRFSMTRKQADAIAAWIKWVQPLAHGKRLVEANCARCHAIDLDDESANPNAPPFRNLSMLYPIDALEEAFGDTIDTGHPGMPVFPVSKVQLQDILSYIGSLQKQ